MHSQTPNTDGQTPLYAAERLVERHFPDLGAKDLVLEPSCGIGAFLRAIPATTSAIGVEIDPERAAIARQRSGRPVIRSEEHTSELQSLMRISYADFSLKKKKLLQT